jgi:hypothetical protein
MNLSNFFKNLALLSHASLVGTIYEGVTPCALEQLASTVSPVMSRRFSHARAEGAAHT